VSHKILDAHQLTALKTSGENFVVVESYWKFKVIRFKFSTALLFATFMVERGIDKELNEYTYPCLLCAWLPAAICESFL
jgi:hypothetical protein